MDIGIVTVNPEEISCESRHSSFRRMNEVKVHKRTFNIYIRIENNQVLDKMQYFNTPLQVTVISMAVQLQFLDVKK